MAPQDLQQMAETLRTQGPAGRFGDPIESAKAVVFLASGASAFTVGSALVIDGGMSTL